MFKKRIIFLGVAILMLSSIGIAQNPLRQSMEDSREILRLKKEAELKKERAGRTATQSQIADSEKGSYKIVQPNSAAPAGMVNVTLTAGNVWNDGSGYQLLLDETATQYGITIPAEDGVFWSGCNAPQGYYDVFSHKIPTNAVPSCNTNTIVVNNSITIQIPAGIYDYCIVNPEPDNILWIASGPNGRRHNYAFQDGFKYHFQAFMDWELGNDYIAITIEKDYRPDVPSAVTGFTVTPGAGGLLNAVLNWTNPLTTFGGETLMELTAVKIYENDVLIRTFPNPPVGVPRNFTAEVTSSGNYTYEIIPENSEGDGPGVSIRTYIGIDVPGAPRNVVLTSSGSSGVITWLAPTSGLNNGWFDVSSLTYTITRLPDNVVIATDLINTTFTDETINELLIYRYRVTSLNSAGTGGNALSNQLMIGDAIPVPYTMGFEDNENYNLWSFSGSVGTWERYVQFAWYDVDWTCSGKALLLCECPYTAASTNAYAFSPPIKFEDGKNYKVRFWAKATWPWYPEKLAVYIASGQSISSIIGEPIWISHFVDNESYLEFETQIIGYPEGNYSIAFHCFSNSMMWSLMVDDVSVLELPDKDASAPELYGTLSPMVGRQFTYKALIRNEGNSVISGYTVKLIDQDDNVLSTNSTGTSIPIGKNLFVDLSWIPETDGDLLLRAVVELEGDMDSSNDISPYFNVSIQPDAEVYLAKIGNGKILDWQVPFCFYWDLSHNQTIYYEHELLGQTGSIVELQFFNSFEANINQNVRIWLANTTQTELNTWIPASEFTLVYNGVANFPSGQNVISFPLSTPFVYEGKNLCVLTDKNNSYYDTVDEFYLTKTPRFPTRTRNWSSVFGPWEPHWLSYSYNKFPNIVFKMKVQGGSVSGTVTDLEMNPLEGAMVELVGSNTNRLTNEDGEYSFELVMPGQHRFKASKHGFFEETSNMTTVVLDENSVVDFELTPIPTYTVSGIVNGSDAPTGLENVTITLTGYDDYTVSSDVNGYYAITGVYNGFTYKLTATKSGYYPYTTNVTINGANVDVGFQLNEILTPPGTISAEVISDNYVKVDWLPPGSGGTTTYILDDGTDELGFAVYPNQTASYGNQFIVNEEGLIISVDIYSQLGYDNTNRVVTVDIYNKNRQLVGSSQPFVLGGDNWVNVELDFVPYFEEFYVMVRWPNTSGYTHYIGYDQTGPNSFDNLDWHLRNNQWSVFWHEANCFPGIFMIRANALSRGKSVTYGYQKDRAFVDYELYRLKKGKPENEWETLLNSTSELSYNDNDWDTLDWGEYQYAVKARYTNNAMSYARFSNVVAKNMYVDYNVTITTNLGVSAQGAVVTLKNQNGNYVFTGTAGADGIAKLSVWRGVYDMTVKLGGYITHTETGISILENGQKSVLIYENPFPVFKVIADYSDTNDNITVSWDYPPPYNEVSYILDDGKQKNAVSFDEGFEASLGNFYNVNEIGEITSVDIYGVIGNTSRLLTVDIYNRERELVGSSKSFYLVADVWNHIELEYVGYTGAFYAMVRFDASNGMPYMGFDENGPQLSYEFYEGSWYNFSQNYLPGVFMIRVNANSYGSAKSYSYNDMPETSSQVVDNIVSILNPAINSNNVIIAPEWIAPKATTSSRVPLDYIVYRFKKGQLEHEWETIATEVTELNYTDNNVSQLPEKIYQYAVRVRYFDDVLSRARLSNVVEITGQSIINDKILSNLELYPNPFRNEIMINIPGEVKSVQITNVIGQNINNIYFDGKTIKTGKLNSGIYFVTIESHSGDKVVYKMVKK